MGYPHTLLASSLPSLQSRVPSHSFVMRIVSPLRHGYVQLASSLPSSHAFSPSQS